MSSDSDEENVIRYGTPLEPYEEDEIPTKRKYQQQPDQYAVDAHGRRRFHGAFTGGFSAGFGNTVGSQEGWAPSTFKSSRTEKALVSSQRPEDFMDEEDRDEFGIAPRHMQTQNEFSGQKRPRQQKYHDGPIPGDPVLEQLVRAVHETAAVRMLRAMGWRAGQGTGERLSREERRRARDHHKVYGCYMPPEMRQNVEIEEDSSDSEFDYETLFAPEDYEPYILCRKNDRFGLGYSGLSRHSVLGNLVGEYDGVGTSQSHLVMKEKGKKVSIRGQAFGVGAFEADDEDIYAREDMSHYDYAIGGATDDKQKKITNKDKTNNVLEGFVKSTKPVPGVPSYPPPALPRDYTPLPAGKRRSRFEPIDQPQRDQGLGRHELTAEARGALLGETSVPKASTQTIPNIPIATSEDPIAKLVVGKTIDLTTNNNKELDYIPITDSGKELTKVFKPFVSNPTKQARYEQYLQGKDSVLEREGDVNNLSEWEREREMAEFEQAAKLYRPLTGIMGDRFTHASEPDDALNPLLAVAKSSTNYGLATAEQIEAAKQGVYGVMTRREAPWRPEAVVCKRFNIPEPGGARLEPKKDDKPKVSYSIFSYLESSVHDKGSFAKEQSKFSGSKSLNRETITKTVQENERQIVKVDQTPSHCEFAKRLTVAELFLKESENNTGSGEKVTDTINKFDKMDLYKSIFLSDSEDDDAIEKDTDKNKDLNDIIDVPKNVERNTSPPRGIFANIDFDELNSWRRNVDDKKSVDSTKEKESNTGNSSKEGDGDVSKLKDTETNEGGEEAIYGPKIPENLHLQKTLKSDVIEQEFKPIFKKPSDVQVIDSSDSDAWIDVKEVKSKKQKRKKTKKHKAKSDKKHKSKHKKKDK